MVFVTGGTGLVGARLIFDLLNRGEQVKALKRPETAPEKALPYFSAYTDQPGQYLERVTWVEGDLLDLDSLLTHIEPECDIYHCAAKVSFFSDDKKLIDETNVEGTANMVNAALINRARKFCHVSSIGALGSMINGSQINEETAWLASGKSAYSFSKYLSELEVWRGMAEGLNAVIVNPSVILGAGNWTQGSNS